MKYSTRMVATVLAAGLAAAGGLQLAATPAHAAAKSSLAGKWTFVLSGVTGCGHTSLYVTVTLNGAATGTATMLGHSTGCPDSNTTETFTVLTFAPDGQGTASLTCNGGVGCGWNFNIQVGRSGNEMILADVTDGGNTPVGMGLRRFP